MSNAPCGIFSEDRITESLLGIKGRIANWISNAIRMPVGILFEMKSTNYVKDELVNAWAPFKAAINTSSNFIELVYDFITTYVLKYMGLIILIIWPFGYILCYNRGPLEFDNVYTYPKKSKKRSTIKSTKKLH
jgi:hypothetical protein